MMLFNLRFIVYTAWALVFGVFIGITNEIRHIYVFPFPSIASLPPDETYLIDMGSILLGMRRIGADIAFVQLMQYYASGQLTKKEKLEIEFHEYISKDADAQDNAGSCAHCGKTHHHDYNVTSGHDQLYDKTLRIVQLDPYFHYAYIYSAGSLAFNLERYDEAFKILELGIKNNPSYWRFSEYTAAIMFKKLGNYNEMVKVLEKIVTFPDCPNGIKWTLAKHYVNEKKYKDALTLLIELYESGDLRFLRVVTATIEEINKELHVK